MEISKSDWKLFRKKLPGWLEAYMEKLNNEYIQLLSAEGSAADKFWALEKRIEKDRHHAGVVVEMRRSMLHYELAGLLCEGAISLDDLEGFSQDLQDAVKAFASLNN